MNKKKFCEWARFVRPHLDLYLDLGFAMLRTKLMVERYELQCREYIGLAWRFMRWSGHVRLYSPHRHLRFDIVGIHRPDRLDALLVASAKLREYLESPASTVAGFDVPDEIWVPFCREIDKDNTTPDS